MAKITLCKDEETKKEFEISFKARVAAAEIRRNVSRADTIKASGLSHSAFYTAWKNPRLFRLDQYMSICDFLRIPYRLPEIEKDT